MKTLLSLLAVGSVALIKSVHAVYVLESDYEPWNFFNQFTFFTGHDPTNGFVDYVNQSVAEATGLIRITDDQVYIGVDDTNVTPNGRPSVRITSNMAYEHGLILLDLEHMPYGCGTWPAFWTVGSDWPNNGEIDIIEGVNSNTKNAMTLHTSDNCTIANDGNFTGAITTYNCYVNAPGQSNNAGCDIGTSDTSTYGAGLAAVGGGVYATEWTSQDISIWWFPRSQIPWDIRRGRPNPARWPKPLAQFQGSCNLDAHIDNQQIVFDDTFCGDWGGNVWQYDPVCAPLAPTCNAYVANNPGAFTNAYWLINSLKVYQQQAEQQSGHAWSGNPGHPPYGVAGNLPQHIQDLCPIPWDGHD